MRVFSGVLALVLMAGGAAAQKQAAATRTQPEPAARPAKGTLASVADLRRRVREMRRSVLGGGPSVWKAEEEALRFYRRKLDETATRLVELRTNRDAREAEYRAALRATLDAVTEAARRQAARRAAGLRGEVEAIQAEIAALERQRTSLGKAIAALEARMERRKRLLAHLDQERLGGAEPGAVPFDPGLAALGPDAGPPIKEDPFADERLWRDLLDVGGREARDLLFRKAPDRYWRLFPLTPPLEPLKAALQFPPPDPPGKR